MATGSPRRRIVVAAATAMLVLGIPASAGAVNKSTPKFSATPLVPSSTVTAFKAPSSRLAQTDPNLLARTDSLPVRVMIKLDYDATASYAGGVDGLAATSPRVTGKKLTGTSAAEQAYGRYIQGKKDTFAAALGSAVPGATIGESFDTVFGGVSAVIPASAVRAVLAIPGVVAVQADTMSKPLTDSSPEFLDAPPVYDALGSTANAGQGVIFGDLDTGVWPEHPSFADLGNLPAPLGPVRQCNFGDNPLTPANDPFVCNNKLIGGVAETLTYDALEGDDPYAGTARDGDGHGTHTTSTAAGNIVESVPVLGVDRGPIHGLAPGAWIIEYKVCGPQGCFGSDSARAVEQAILDGVNVINFSISGGSNPFTDPVELAFLDAYDAGVFVAASAGNAGPGAGTTDHLGPWVTTVAASTQTREFATTLNLTAGTDTFSADGASITAGAGPLPVVLAQDVPGYTGGAGCSTLPPAADTFAGLIVACRRGGEARAWKGFVVSQGGGAGMVLYNASLADVETDNHWVPTIHLADGRAFVAFMTAHAGTVVTGSFAAAEKRNGQGDVMAAFSSRGPGGLFIKPDVTAPGVQILAGNTPTPEAPTTANGAGPAGQYYQAIAGTSMSSPHVAGAALLLFAVHPDWSPGEVKSALMTTATTKVVKEDLSTPADPFDFGAGRIDIGAAAGASLVLDESAIDFFEMGNDPIQAVQLNIPSIDAPVLPGRLVVTRTVTNASGSHGVFDVSTTAPAGSSIDVQPGHFTLGPGQSQQLTITISTNAPMGAQQFGAISIATHKGASQHLPVAFIHTQGTVSLAQGCNPAQIPFKGAATCDVSATNNSFDAQTVNLDTTTNQNLNVLNATGATVVGGAVQLHNVTLAGAQPGVPSLSVLGPLGSGYLPLTAFGVTPDALGDETAVNYDTPPFVYDGQTWSSIGVTSDGYAVVGGATSQDVVFEPPTAPSPDRPNNVLAPFWTDLNGLNGADPNLGSYVAVLRDSVSGNRWLVLESRLDVFGTTDTRILEIWIGLNGVQDITMDYGNAQALPKTQPFLVGAENILGQGQMAAVLPTTDFVVSSTDPVPGDTVSYKVFVQGSKKGDGVVTTQMTASGVPGVTIVQSPVKVLDKK